MKTQGNMMPPKEHNNNFPVAKTVEMEICNSSNKEFKIVVFRKLSELKKTQTVQQNQENNTQS